MFWENGREPERPSVEHRTLKLVLCASAVPNSLDLTASTHTYMRAHTHMYRVCVGEHLYV